MQLPQEVIECLLTLRPRLEQCSGPRTGWPLPAWLLLWALKLALLLLLLSRRVLPFVLRRLSRHARIRSISFRSVKGLYVRAGPFTLQAERIGYRYTPNDLHPFTIKLSGLRFRIYTNSPRPPPKPITSSFFRRRVVPIGRMFSSLGIVHAAYLSASWWIRPAFHLLVVTFGKVFVGLIAALTQRVQCETDQFILDLIGQDIVRMSLKDIRLALNVVLSPIQRPSNPPLRTPRISNATARIVSYWGTHFGTRFKDSVSRNWDKAWRGTEGTASMTTTVASLQVSKIATLSTSYSASGTLLLEMKQRASLSCGLRFNLGGISVIADALQQSLSRSKSPPNESEKQAEVTNPLPDSTQPQERQLMNRLRSVMVVNRFKRALKVNVSRRRERIRSWMTCLDHIEVGLEDISIAVSLKSPTNQQEDLPKIALSTRRMLLSCCRSTPSTSELHRQWLGSQDREGNANTEIPLFCSVNILSIACSIDASKGRQPPPLIQLASASLTGLSNNWPNHRSALHLPDLSDPNDSLLVCNIELGEVASTVHLDSLGPIAQVLSRGKPRTPTTRSRRILPPSIHIGVHMQEINIVVKASEIEDHPTALLHLNSGGLSAQTNLQYNPLPRRLSPTTSKPNQNNQSMAIDMELRAYIHPTFVWSFHSSSALHQNAPLRPDPILSLAFIDVVVGGSAVTLYEASFSDIMFMDAKSWLWEIRIICDDIALDLWNADSLASLSETIQAAGLIREATNDREPISPSRPMSTVGISCFLSVANITACITGSDPSPTGKFDLRRGIYMKTTLNSSFCAIPDVIPFARIRGIVSHSHNRQRLGLGRDPLLEVNGLASSEDGAARFNLFVPSIHIRRSTSTDYDTDVPRADNIEELSRRLESDDMLAKLSGINVNLAISENKAMTALNACTIDIRSAAISFHLLTAHSALLAGTTIAGLARTKEPRVVRETSLSPRFGSIQVRLRNFDLMAALPLGGRICFVATDLSSSSGSAEPPSLSVSRIGVLVPSCTSKAKWERLGLIRELSLRQPTATHPFALELAMDSLAFRIPWRFVLADLIQDITVAQKALKQIWRISRAGYFFEMETPGEEPAKMVPPMHVAIARLVFEACDDTFESAFSLITRTGEKAQAVRGQREAAFSEKVATINAQAAAGQSEGYSFTSDHSVSVDEAWFRLQSVHSASWILAYNNARDSHENSMKSRSRIWSTGSHPSYFPIELLESKHRLTPPLFRIEVDKVDLDLKPPSFAPEKVTEFIHERGGTPLSTPFNLLVPLHLDVRLGSLIASIRDYPLPLISVPVSSVSSSTLTFRGDLVIAEELGPPSSVQWVECQITAHHPQYPDEDTWSLRIPKTAMPVKTFGKAVISVTSEDAAIAWGVSYMPALQSLSKVLETLSHPPRDASPALGFWDKLRLILHCDISIKFNGGVDVHLKGSRDPYELAGPGAGFSLCWRGTPTLSVGRNSELFQLSSEEMLIVIPDFSSNRTVHGKVANKSPSRRSGRARPRKVIAHFRNGIMMGLGFAFERACRQGCADCSHKEAFGSCRIFHFKPHWKVQLRASSEDGPDSYEGFRSDYIHFSVSLTSPYRTRPDEGNNHSSAHLSALTFAHFWKWWGLFNGPLSLPVGQGKLFPDARPPSPKFGKHLATIKYRIIVEKLFIAHVYNHDTVESWRSGETHMVGIKLAVSKFQADMHQRDEDSITVTPTGKTTVTHRKAFHSTEVVIRGLDLRSMYAVFSDPEKLHIQLPKESLGGVKKPWGNAERLERSLEWYSNDDWTEVDIAPPAEGAIYWAEVAKCPMFTYFKPLHEDGAQPSTDTNEKIISRFGGEQTHDCVIGKEPSITQYQITLAQQRLEELKGLLQQWSSGEPLGDVKTRTLDRQASHLSSYIMHLKNVETKGHSRSSDGGDYIMPAEEVSSQDWQEFSNVYQIHSPSIHLTNVTRNIMIQYYYASRSRRGFEYHMTNRAVKFILDQAEALFPESQDQGRKSWNASSGAYAAAHVLRKMLIRDDRKSEDDSVGISMRDANPAVSRLDPSLGWNQKDVYTERGHFCLLIKPQIVLQSEKSSDSTVVLASTNMSLQVHTIIDRANVSDPVNGPIMTRTYASLRGLQAFSPSSSTLHQNWDHRCVPLEVLVDYRCESTDFDRLVPQTDATLQYDKFNRLRLRNNVRSVGFNDAEGIRQLVEHLHYHTDLIAVNVPRLAVLASSSHFGSISHVVTDLLLYSDPMFQRRSEELETYLFLYDFRELKEAAKLVISYQRRIHELQASIAQLEASSSIGDQGSSLTELRAQVFIASEDLDVVFEAIKLAQEKSHGQRHDQKLAVRLLATSSEITWQMTDNRAELLAKLSVKDVGFSWLSRQDSSTVNKLVIRDLQAFDGAPGAIWPEILSKHKEPASHPLVKKGIFAESDWCILPAVGGISIYESFKLDLHPIRLQIQTSIGSRIMEYVWPARRPVGEIEAAPEMSVPETPTLEPTGVSELLSVNQSSSKSRPGYIRSMGSKSFTDLTTTLKEPQLSLKRSRSFLSLASEAASDDDQITRTMSLVEQQSMPAASSLPRLSAPAMQSLPRLPPTKRDNDAVVMRGRSSQKTFVLVQVSSLNLLLSIAKEDAFLCREARIKTRELVYRNQTWSFEELAHQFIPSDPSWKGWVKMALQQPLLPVLPVAKELFSKTKWGSKASVQTSLPWPPPENRRIRDGEESQKDKSM